MSMHVTDRLSAYMDHELSVVDAAAVREHLASCVACAGRLAHLEAVDSSLRDLPVEAPAGYFDSFAARVRGRIESAPRARAGFRLPVWSWAVAAAALLAVVLPTTLRESRAPRPGAPSPAVPMKGAGAPSASPLYAEREEQPRASAPATVEPEVTQKLRAPGYGAPASRDDKSRTKTITETADAPGRSTIRKDTSPTPQPFANAPPAAPPAIGQAASAETGKPDAFSDDNATAAQAAAEAPLRDEDETRPPVARSLKKEQGQEADAAASPEVAASAAGRSDEGKRSRPAAAKSMAIPLSPVEAEYRALEASTTAASLAELRDAWGAFALRHPDDPRADEARVRVIALGIDIARRTGLRSDEAQARKDAADYLARKDAAQKERVRALLDDLSS